MASCHLCPVPLKPSRREESGNGRRSAAEVVPVRDAMATSRLEQTGRSLCNPAASISVIPS